LLVRTKSSESGFFKNCSDYCFDASGAVQRYRPEQNAMRAAFLKIAQIAALMRAVLYEGTAPSKKQ